MTGRALLLAVLIQINASQSIPQAKGLIEGTVVRMGTMDPIEDTLVVLTKGLPPTADPDLTVPPSWSWTTNSDGRFVFKDLEPGKYRLSFASNGYVRQEYGQRAFPGKGSSFDIEPGQTMKNIVVDLIPAGSVSGHIRNKDRQPVVAVTVQLLRYGYDEKGERALRPFGSAATDDRGEYRIFHLTPGRYYLSAGTPTRATGYGLGRNEIREPYGFEFYPGVSDIRQAAVIDVQSGSDLRGLDLTLEKEQLYKVRGRVVDAVTGLPPTQPQLRLNFRDPATGGDYDLGSISGDRGSYENGVFEFRNVFPGAYSVSATVEERGSSSAAAPSTRRTGARSFEITGADVEGLVVTIAPGASLPGIIRTEGNAVPADALMGMQFSPTSNVPSGVPWPYARMNPDGTFRLDNLMPGEYRLSILGLPWGFYFKSAKLGPVDVLKAPLRFSGAESGPLDVVISSNVASLIGVVTGEQLEPVAAASVALVPDGRDRVDLFRTARTDQNGRFNISAVAPGDYKIFAWAVLDPYAYFDPEVLRAAEPSGTTVRAGELSSLTVNVKVIAGPRTR